MWDTKYRPKNFSEVIGQAGPVEVLKSRLKQGHGLDTSYIFSGGAGRGKTTLARILARALLCQNLTSETEPCNVCDNCQAALAEEFPAIVEMDAASGGTMEHIKDIVDKLPFIVQGAPKKVYIIDECHRISKDAQDVLLKPIEEKKMVAILCTTESEKIRGTIQTRCENHKIRTITRDDILERMKYILSQEGVEAQDDAVLTVIDRSGGHVRDAINKLEMLAHLGPITVESVREYLNLGQVSKYYEILLALGDPAQSIAAAEQVLESTGPEELYEGLAEAAMNSFRLANNMFADFSYVDRQLATQVHGLYGNNVIQLAGYFARAYKVSRTSLFSDLVACSSGVPERPAASAAPPVVVSATVVQAAPVPVVARPVEAQGQTQAQAPAPTAAPKEVKAEEAKKLPEAYPMTEIERKAMPATLPRDNSRGASTVITPIKPTHSADPYMPTSEFRSKLLRLMKFGKGDSV